MRDHVAEVVVLIVDDLHWIDPASEEFVESIVDAIVGTKTLLVLNFRPGVTAPFMERSHYRQIGLAPLSSGEAADFSTIYWAATPRSHYCLEILQNVGEATHCS